MRRRETVGNPYADFHYFAPRHNPVLNAFAHRLSFEQFGHGVENTLVGTKIMDSQNVGVGKGRHGSGFTLEAGAGLGITGKIFRQNLDGYSSLQPGIDCPVYFSLASRTKRADNLV